MPLCPLMDWIPDHLLCHFEYLQFNWPVASDCTVLIAFDYSDCKYLIIGTTGYVVNYVIP